MKSKLRILIVDDDQRITHTLADILTVVGYEIEESTSGQQALEKVKTQVFDCVLADVRMPGMNGVELHSHLRQILPGLPVLLMTAYTSQDIILKGLDEGVVGVLNKPLDLTLLLGFLASLAKNRTLAIVDDDPAFCMRLSDILQHSGFSVKIIKQPRWDVDLTPNGSQTILLDMKLGSDNGLDVLKSIRARYPSLPVLLVTSYRQEMPKSIQAALEVGAYTCLYKPLVITDMLQKLTEIRVAYLRKSLNEQLI